MKPGVYTDIPNDQHHAADGISKSGLDLIARSPYLYRHRQAVEQTKAMLIGSAVHCAVLEPALFPHRYTVAPVADGRTKAGKDEGPRCALFEADGGAWRATAVETIKSYMVDNLDQDRAIIIA